MPVFKVICKENEYFNQNGVGKYKDDDALYDVISYCTRAGKACCVDGIAVYPPNAICEMELLARAYGKDCGLRLRHWVLSFSTQELKGIRKKQLPEALHKFGWYAASYYGEQYQILFSVHLDSDNPHIHFVMNTVNYKTGRKYPGDKADYYNYQRFLQDFFSGLGMVLMVSSDQ